MAEIGKLTFDVDVKVTSYWQVCPVCTGCGTVPPDFYTRLGCGTSLAREQCRRCKGTGTIAVPIVAGASA